MYRVVMLGVSSHNLSDIILDSPVKFWDEHSVRNRDNH